jgi:hypothetical protein
MQDSKRAEQQRYRKEYHTVKLYVRFWYLSVLILLGKDFGFLQRLKNTKLLKCYNFFFYSK